MPGAPATPSASANHLRIPYSWFWSAVAYDVPVTFLVLQNQEYGILKWFAEAEGVAGAPGLDLPKLDVASVAEGYGIKAHRTADRDGAAGALATALASSKPELVEVPVAPGMSLF